MFSVFCKTISHYPEIESLNVKWIQDLDILMHTAARCTPN